MGRAVPEQQQCKCHRISLLTNYSANSSHGVSSWTGNKLLQLPTRHQCSSCALWQTSRQAKRNAQLSRNPAVLLTVASLAWQERKASQILGPLACRAIKRKWRESQKILTATVILPKQNLQWGWKAVPSFPCLQFFLIIFTKLYVACRWEAITHGHDGLCRHDFL